MVIFAKTENDNRLKNIMAGKNISDVKTSGCFYRQVAAGIFILD